MAARIAIAVCLFFVADAACAVPITFGFAGRVRFVSAATATPGVVVGTPVSGSYTFESTTPDADPSSNGGDYLQAVTAVGILLGDFEIVYTPNLLGRILVSKFALNDSYSVDARGTTLKDGFENTVLLDFRSTGAPGLLASDALPLVPPVPPNIAQFPLDVGLQWNIRISDSEVRSTRVRLAIDSFYLVPEPSSLHLLLVGLLALSARRRARSLALSPVRARRR